MTDQPGTRDLIQKWQVLRTDVQSERVAVFPVFRENSPFRAWASVDGRGLPQMLLGLDVNEEYEYTRTEGKISVRIRPLDYRNQPVTVLEVQCELAELEHVFADFCVSALTRITSGELPQTAIDGLLDDLQQLLAGGGASRTSEVPALGLAGELIVLRDLVRIDAALVAAWQGPRGGRHDFRWADDAIEVKTYIRRQSRQVSISSLDQLEPPADGRLFLAEVCLEHNAAGEITLAALTDDIGRCLYPGGKREFINRLSEMEVTDSDVAGPWSLKYVNTFIVGQGFPSLTSNHLTAGRVETGISHVSYRLDFSAADRWSYDGNLAAELLKQEAN